VLTITLDPENTEVLLKDSLYSAIGLASASLEQHLDFNSFLQSTLISEVQIQQQGYNLLRRRIAIVLGQWMPVKPGELNRATVYQIFQHLLNKDDPLNDQVVRVTAGRQLKNVIDPYEFTAEGFLPYAPPILQGIMNLIQEVELPETKMGLLETVRVVVVKMEDHVRNPHTSEYWAGTDRQKSLDFSIYGSDYIIVTPVMGTIGRSSFNETSNPDSSMLIDPFDERKLCSISFHDSSPNPQVCRSRIGKFSVSAAKEVSVWR
jgi:hypothetical protein